MQAVLVIEHDVHVGQLFESALRSAGHTVYLTLDAPQAFDILRRVPVGVVITDLNMPNGSGLDIVSVMHHDFPNTKIIGISGAATEFDPVQAAPLLETVDVLPNPLDVSRLLATVKHALNVPESS
jgi:DNA-binding NtrC family response regulator